jgi:hypothetical protein
MITLPKRAHRLLHCGGARDVLSDLSFEEMGQIYGDEYLGEVSITTGLLMTPYISPRVKESMQEAASEYAFINGMDTYGVWVQAGGVGTRADFMRSIAPPKEPAMYDPLFEEIFGMTNVADFVVVSPELKNAIDKMNEPEPVGVIQVREPTAEDYAAAAAGLIPFPSRPTKPLMEVLPELKGVFLKQSKMSPEMEALFASIMGAHAENFEQIFDLAKEEGRKAQLRWMITYDQFLVNKALAKFLRRCGNAAELLAEERRSGDKQMRLFAIAEKAVHDQFNVAVEELFAYTDEPYEYIIDAVQDNTFNLAIRNKHGVIIPMLSIKYAAYGFTFTAHR